MKIECKKYWAFIFRIDEKYKKPICNFELKMQHQVNNMLESSLRVKNGVKRYNFKDMKFIKSGIVLHKKKTFFYQHSIELNYVRLCVCLL